MHMAPMLHRVRYLEHHLGGGTSTGASQEAVAALPAVRIMCGGGAGAAEEGGRDGGGLQGRKGSAPAPLNALGSDCDLLRVEVGIRAGLPG